MGADDLLIALQSRLKHTLAPFCNLQNRNDFIAASQKFSDVLHGFFVLLAKTDVNVHPDIWTSVLTSFIECSVHISVQHNQFKKSLDVQCSHAVSLYKENLLQIVKYLESFYRVFHPNPDCKNIYDDFILLSTDTTTYIIECVGMLPLQALAKGLGASLLRFLSSSSTVHNEYVNNRRLEIVSLVTQTSKAALYSGCPSAVLPLVFSPAGYISDSFVLPLIGHDDFSINMIIDHFKYAGYCLVSCVAEQDAVNDELTRKADMYFRILLNLPNLQLTNYNLELQNYGDLLSLLSTRYVSFLEREELAFFYVLNRLLMFRSLETFASADKYFETELKFFIDSFNFRVGSELDQLVSVPLSRNGSYVSVPKAGEPIPDSGVETNLTLSSILTDGSYKERLKLVVSFFRHFSTVGKQRLSGLRRFVNSYDLSQLHTHQDHTQLESASNEILGLVSRMDFTKFPGKQLYLKAIDKIVRLVQLLSLKFYVTTAGISQLPMITLKQAFISDYTLEQILLVKPLLSYEKDELSVTGRREMSDDERYLHQLKLFEKTKALENSLQRLL